MTVLFGVPDIVLSMDATKSNDDVPLDLTSPPAPFDIAGLSVSCGTRAETEIAVSKLVTGAPVSMPLIVLHGASPGPTIWLNAAIHGDEINGVEIIRRVIETIDPAQLSGTILAVPVVNVSGFVTGDRYLPDRRDLNRCFPGSPRGPLGNRTAHIFMNEIVRRCSAGIDFHSGSDHRTNLPQIRADLDDEPTRTLASAFAAPVMLHSDTRDGSLRRAATKAGASVLLFEGGEAWRFDSGVIRSAVTGTLNVLSALAMIQQDESIEQLGQPSIEARTSRWVRARASGITQLWVDCGDLTTKGQTIGRLHDSFGHRISEIRASVDGIVIGLNLDPTVNQGDAIVHIAEREPDTD